MTEPPTARRLMVIVDEDDTFEHTPVFREIVRRARDAGLAGASVFRGIEGYGTSRHLHTNRLLDLTGSLPAMIIIIDTAENVQRFLPLLDELAVRGVVAVDDVEIVRPGQLPEAARP